MLEGMYLHSALLMSIGLGLLHALDADHIAAVTALNARTVKTRRCVLFSLHWGLGHALLLLVLGALVFGFGIALPARFGAIADQLVAVLLIVIGIGVLLSVYQRRVRLTWHRHEGGRPHLHWCVAVEAQANQPRHDHRALLVGMLHGAAGAGPVLALLPVALVKSPVWALAYVGVFGLSVALAMMVFGGVLGALLSRLVRHGVQFMRNVQIGVASLSIGTGAWMLFA